MDGGSTDGTVDILKKYQSKLKWFSQKDKGQTDAINKGLKIASGEIIGYLNSDDLYLSETLSKVSRSFINNPELFWLTGKCQIINDTGKSIRSIATDWKNFWLNNLCEQKKRLAVLSILNYISQPATFWRREAYIKIGGFDDSLKYTMDYDYWFRLMTLSNYYFIDEYIAEFRVHKRSKGVEYTNEQFSEGFKVSRKYNSNIIIKTFHRMHDIITLSIYRILGNI